MKDSSTNLANVTVAHAVPLTQPFHLIGVGGAGMSVVAQLLHELGYRVSGSDQVEADTLVSLRENGITCYVGHRGEQVPSDAIVVVTSALREDNPEYLRAVELGLEVWHRSVALAFCTYRHDTVAVAGAHGKTSTSAMISHALYASDADPSFAVGGVLSSVGTGARLGRGRFFVIEADESDGSFLNYVPLVEVLTNIEADHLDHWGSSEAFESAFVDFTGKLRPGGFLVLCADDPGIQRLARRFNPVARVVSYGFGESLVGADVGVSLSEVVLGAGFGRCQVNISEDGHEVFRGMLRLQVGGKHMLLNAGAALAVAYVLGVDLVSFLDGLASFSGVGRRMEYIGQCEGVRIYDDYGHHPTEIAAALDAARSLAGEGRLLVCFQPHLYSRTYNFASQFAEVLSFADQVVVCGVYAAREDPIRGVNGNTISDLMGEKGCFIEDMYAAGEAAFAMAKRGDLLLFLGAGSITRVGHEFVCRAGCDSGGGF